MTHAARKAFDGRAMGRGVVISLGIFHMYSIHFICAQNTDKLVLKIVEIYVRKNRMVLFIWFPVGVSFIVIFGGSF